MSQLTKDQVKEVAEVISRYAKPLDYEQIQQEERQRQKLITYLKSQDEHENKNNQENL